MDEFKVDSRWISLTSATSPGILESLAQGLEQRAQRKAFDDTRDRTWKLLPLSLFSISMLPDDHEFTAITVRVKSALMGCIRLRFDQGTTA